MATKNAKKLTAKSKKSKLTAALKERLVVIRHLLGEGERYDARGRYEIGILVLETKTSDGSKKYGTKAVRQMATDLEMDESTIYAYAVVPETWDRLQFSGLLKRKNTKGRPLTFSHLLELAKLPSAKREKMTAEVLQKSLSVGELKRRLDPAHGQATSDPAERTKALADKADSTVERSRSWQRDVLNQLQPAKLDDNVRKALGAARRVYADLAVVGSQIVAQIDKTLAKPPVQSPIEEQVEVSVAEGSQG